MSRIPLRKYIQEIETFIQNGNLEKAQKHCWYILQNFPKYIQCYRLLGKALMEKSSYEDATFVFNKVLDVFPADFVSHIGMSFIAEVNNQLDEAVMHMEWAFEFQPTNAVIKEELKRLHLKKDGIEPQAIRLTRGALVNMYLRSSLYPQAIAELRIGLQTNPNRIDFKEQLADALLKNGEKIEAVQKAIEIIGQAPFNFTANRIVYETLPNTSDAMDTEAFHQHLIDVDPYFLYVGEKISKVEDVPDIAVGLDKYDGKKPSIDLDTINWQAEIDKIWETPSRWSSETKLISDIDWESVIETRLSDEKEKTAEIPIVEMENEKPAHLEHEPQEGDESSVADNNLDEPLIPSEQTVGNIPGWIFDNPDTAKEDLPATTIPVTEKPTEIPLPDFEEHPLESGMVDHDIPAISEPESEAISSHWLKMENEPATTAPKSNLEDTQKIVDGDDDALLFQQALKAVEGENFQFAVKNLDHLVEKEYHLEEIIHLIEQHSTLLSHEPVAWLVLGKAYLKLNQKEKALQAFRKAEEISFY